MIPTVLSIDNDFFPWYPAEREMMEIVAPAGEMAGQKVQTPAGLVFDWGHSENQGFYFDALWKIRAGSFQRLGLDLEKIYNVRCDKGGVTYSRFGAEILRRFDIAQVTAADSHVAAMPFIYSLERPVYELIHFDAHHDLGYSPKSVGANKADCGDWLYHMLTNLNVYSATIVYPDWRKEHRPGKWINALKRSGRITFTTWSEWLAGTADDETREAECFSCRSGAWAPPYMDPQWLGLMSDISPSVVFPENDGSDIPREWDSDEIRLQAREETEALGNLMTMTEGVRSGNAG